MPATVSTELRDTVLQRQADGATITQIAQELGISRPTVYKALAITDNLDSLLKDKSSNIRRLAYNAIEKGLSTNRRDSARLGLDWLKLTDFAQASGDTFNIKGDVQYAAITTMLPSRTGTASPAESTSPALPAAAGDPSSREAPANDISVSIHTNFSQFSTAQLEAELARRRQAEAITVEPEVVGG